MSRIVHRKEQLGDSEIDTIISKNQKRSKATPMIELADIYGPRKW